MSRAGTGAREQVARLLTLVPLLHARGDLPVAEAAEALGTTQKQLVKDLKVLWMCGLPGGFPDDLIDIDMDSVTDPDGDGTIRVWNADYLAQPVRLTPTEASALVVALRALRERAGDDAAEVVDRALAKLERAASAGPDAGSLPVALARPDAGTASLVRAETAVADLWSAALSQGRQIRMTYWSQARDSSGIRVVDPLHVTRVEGRTYLQAWCHDAQGLRVFRADRAEAVVIREEPVEDHPGAALRDLARELFDPGAETPVMTLRLGPRARWVASYHPIADARELTSGHVEVDLEVADPEWLTGLVLRLAPEAIPADPQFRSAVLDACRTTLGFYN